MTHVNEATKLANLGLLVIDELERIDGEIARYKEMLDILVPLVGEGHELVGDIAKERYHLIARRDEGTSILMEIIAAVMLPSVNALPA
ncbi:hypothetical protein [Mesorhizobium sp.]|uniref:hypothetical protein n=1 Tax=Mesorhizobium sp. TaxID=1871066 RepID=UPI000FEA4898|nr:hypothetical protein [Mesorhizobium sp.]RWM84328.1 MAG: hypothetical protein EOR83_17050 [Mesorhizobium sp.]